MGFDTIEINLVNFFNCSKNVQNAPKHGEKTKDIKILKTHRKNPT